MFRRTFIFVFFIQICCFLKGSIAFAESLPADSNLREACRLRVAGRFLELYDIVEKNKVLVQQLTLLIRRLNKVYTSSSSRLDSLQAEVRNSEFDASRHEQQKTLNSKVKLYKHSIDQQKGLLLDAERKQKQAELDLTEYRHRIKKVFKIEKMKGRGHGYKFAIDFKKACPEFQFSCALPKELAQDLLSMFQGSDIAKVCDRYAHFMQW